MAMPVSNQDDETGRHHTWREEIRAAMRAGLPRPPVKRCTASRSALYCGGSGRMTQRGASVSAAACKLAACCSKASMAFPSLSPPGNSCAALYTCTILERRSSKVGADKKKKGVTLTWAWSLHRLSFVQVTIYNRLLGSQTPGSNVLCTIDSVLSIDMMLPRFQGSLVPADERWHGLPTLTHCPLFSNAFDTA